MNQCDHWVFSSWEVNDDKMTWDDMKCGHDISNVEIN